MAEYGSSDCTFCLCTMLGTQVTEDKCASGGHSPPDSGSLQAHLHNTDTHRHTQTHTNVYIHHNLNRDSGIPFIMEVWHTHTLRPNLCHIPHPVWHSLNLSLGLSNDGLQGQRDEQIIWLKWGITVSVEIGLTGKCPRCYVLDNEYAEGGETPGSWHRFISPHSDGLIPVTATATQCPSTELKIATEAKNSWELCSLKAALTLDTYN